VWFEDPNPEADDAPDGGVVNARVGAQLVFSRRHFLEEAQRSVRFV
jgi:hypothetical protein